MECVDQPVNKQNWNHLVEGEALFTFFQVFAITSVAFLFCGMVMSLAGQNSITISDNSDSKNRNSKIAGLFSFLAGAFVFTIAGVFIAKEIAGSTYEIAFGLYLCFIVGVLAVLASVLNFMSSGEEREIIDDDEQYELNSGYTQGMSQGYNKPIIDQNQGQVGGAYI